jgi:SAM-dependent methyltransferase
MAKQDEIDYVANLASRLGVPVAEVNRHLSEKPYADPGCGRYFMDLGQLLALLPPPPLKLLDLGCGSGWTSEIFARNRYGVLGLDVSSDMVALARRRASAGLDLRFAVHDWELEFPEKQFGAAVVYDALHHATDPDRVVRNVYEALRPGGVLVTIEPGRGHSMTPETLAVVQQFGTTERDMPFEIQEAFMRKAGFSRVSQYPRLSQLIVEDLRQVDGRERQSLQFGGLLEATCTAGLTSIVVATK